MPDHRRLSEEEAKTTEQEVYEHLLDLYTSGRENELPSGVDIFRLVRGVTNCGIRDAADILISVGQQYQSELKQIGYRINDQGFLEKNK